MAKVEIDIDVDEFRKQFDYLLDQASHDVSEEQEGLLNLCGGIRDALEEQGIEVFPNQDAEAGLDKERFDFINLWGEKAETYFDINTYAYYGNLAIDLMDKDPDLGVLMPYGSLTCNIEPLPPYCAAVDTNNLSGAVVNALEEQGIAKQVGYAQSGYCTYPIMEFNRRALERLDPRGAKEYAQAVGADEQTEEKEKTPSLSDRANAAKEVSSGMEQDVPDRNFGDMER